LVALTDLTCFLLSPASHVLAGLFYAPGRLADGVVA
jgi:hypothetical protein